MLRALRLAPALRRHPDIAALLEAVDRDANLRAAAYEHLVALHDAATGVQSFEETHRMQRTAQGLVSALRRAERRR